MWNFQEFHFVDLPYRALKLIKLQWIFYLASSWTSGGHAAHREYVYGVGVAGGGMKETQHPPPTHTPTAPAAATSATTVHTANIIYNIRYQGLAAIITRSYVSKDTCRVAYNNNCRRSSPYNCVRPAVDTRDRLPVYCKVLNPSLCAYSQNPIFSSDNFL